MRERTLVIVVAATALAVLAWPLARPAELASSPTVPTSVVPMPAPPPPGTSRFKLIVGDTLPIALRPSNAVTLSAFDGGVPQLQTIFTSTDTTVADVVNGSIIARSPGVDTITATQVGVQGVSGAIVIEVVTLAQAVNDMVVEVCPNEEDSAYVRASQPLTTEHDPIHEFHDCQRLMEGRQYSVLAGIFAHRNVRKYDNWQDYRNGRLVATIINFVGDSPRVYRPLGLSAGTSCLILRATSDTVWQAALVPQRDSVMRATGRSYEQCVDRERWELTDAQWDPLEVKIQYGVDMDGKPNVPPVARWDWDRRRWSNYMGVKCANHWCEVGPDGFLPSKPLKIGVLKKRPVIKGYYDQQYLADETGEHPTTVFGTIHPGAALEALGKMKAQEEHWYDVAEIELHETAGDKTPDYWRYVHKYAGKSLLDPLLGHTKQSDLDLRPDPEARDLMHLYKGRLDGDTLKTHSVVYHHHGNLKGMPPTVRWRWVEDDERTWSYCDPEGCCETAKLLQ